jgi:hypothetical protein
MTALTGYILLLHYIYTSKVWVSLCQVSMWVGVVHVAKKLAGKGSVLWSSESLALVLPQLFASMPLINRTLLYCSLELYICNEVVVFHLFLEPWILH